MNRWLFRISAALGFLGVAGGAFGAHGLEGRVTADALETFETAVLYHLLHSVVLLFLAAFEDRHSLPLRVSVSFLGGIVLFSGSLYGWVLTGIQSLVWVTPVGGLLFLAGWLQLTLLSLNRPLQS